MAPAYKPGSLATDVQSALCVFDELSAASLQEALMLAVAMRAVRVERRNLRRSRSPFRGHSPGARCIPNLSATVQLHYDRILTCSCPSADGAGAGGG